jgi:hypothetical protein
MPIPNIQHSDKYSITISNIPGYSPKTNNTDNMSLYDLYVKEVTFPAHSLELIKSDFRGFHINHPGSKINDNLNTLDITFKCSEGMRNWYYIYNWMKTLREGVNTDKEKWFRLNFIKEIRLSFLDNQKREQFVYRFSNSFITNLSSLSLTNGQDNELSFTITIEYEDFGVDEGICND